MDQRNRVDYRQDRPESHANQNRFEGFCVAEIDVILCSHVKSNVLGHGLLLGLAGVEAAASVHAALGGLEEEAVAGPADQGDEFEAEGEDDGVADCGVPNWGQVVVLAD